MTNEIKEILDSVKKCCDITKDQSFTIYQRQDILKLLDCITNLQEKLNLYENPDDMTLFYMWLDEKAKDKMKELQEDFKEADEAVEYWQEQCDNLQQRIDKANQLIEKHKRKDGFLNLNEWQTRDLSNILRGNDNE